jgi:TFIIF-interacting CTD phosphatase-like protein
MPAACVGRFTHTQQGCRRLAETLRVGETKVFQNKAATCNTHTCRDKWLWTKLRPAVHEFLQELRPLYELHIYTMGDR